MLGWKQKATNQASKKHRRMEGPFIQVEHLFVVTLNIIKSSSRLAPG